MRTELYEEHIKLDAKMVDFAGWEMPIQYKNLKAEVLAVREKCGVFDVSHMGEFLVTGKETIAFIDKLLPCKIIDVPNSKAIYSPLCNDEGTIIDDLIVYKISGNEIFICVNASNIAKDFSWIKAKSHDFDVTVQDLSNEYSLLALQGPDSYKVLKSLEQFRDLQDISYYSIQKFESQTSIKPMIARTGYTGEDGFEIFGDRQFIKNLWIQLIDLGVTPCGLGARDVLRLEVAYPLYGNELNEEVTPLECGLKWTIDKDKEDFIGKSSMESKPIKTSLVKLVLDKGIPRTGYKVFDANDSEIGVVTSGSMSVMLSKGIAIARINKSLYNNHEDLYIEIRDKKYTARKQTQAFYSGGHK